MDQMPPVPIPSDGGSGKLAVTHEGYLTISRHYTDKFQKATIAGGLCKKRSWRHSRE